MIDMGLNNYLSDQNLIGKMTNRWELTISGICGNYGPDGTIPPYFVKTAGRPKMKVTPIEINYLNAKGYWPGKVEWEAIEVEYRDMATKDIAPLYRWLNTIYTFNSAKGNVKQFSMASKPQDWGASAQLSLYDGLGNTLEQWSFKYCFPENVDWGDLKYEEMEFASVKLTLRYSGVSYTPVCPDFEITSCATGCG